MTKTLLCSLGFLFTLTIGLMAGYSIGKNTAIQRYDMQRRKDFIKQQQTNQFILFHTSSSTFGTKRNNFDDELTAKDIPVFGPNIGGPGINHCFGNNCLKKLEKGYTKTFIGNDGNTHTYLGPPEHFDRDTLHLRTKRNN